MSLPGSNQSAVARAAGPGMTALLAMLSAFGPMSVDMYLPSLPSMTEALGAGPTLVQLTLSAFFLGFALGQLVYGPLSDRYGRRRPLLAGLLLYTAASLICAVTPSIWPFIFGRLLQGLGACAGPVLARAVVRDLYDRDRAARMLSILFLVLSAAPLLAPSIGGQILIWIGWRAIFAVLTIFGVVSLLSAGLFLRETLPLERRRRIGPVEALHSYAGMLRDRRFMGYAGTSALAMAGFFVYLSASPFVFITLFGVPAERYGILFAINVAGLMAGATVNSRLVVRLGSDRLLGYGVSGAAAAGTVLAIVAASPHVSLLGIAAPLFCFVASMSFIGANATAGALANYPQLAGTASALQGMLQWSMGALSGALVALAEDGTAVPMAALIGAAGVASLLVYRKLVRPDAAR
jgi:DHA1 family bicyclomycin/chloramphenicol resistance-like MFS transporter